ncbi:hypothetical protein A0U40_18570 [[Bacillus] sp. KCTC 13219]|nr:hypothetical protein A0U40_18570 [[Bacillus] sp. KCTC 13219]
MSKLNTVKAVKQQRFRLSVEQDTLAENHCSPCPSKVCDQCAIYTRLRAIGSELTTLSQKGRKLKAMSKLTVGAYEDLKAQGKTDKAIMQQYGMYANKFNAWKKENGLVQERERNKSEVTTMIKSEPKVIAMEAVAAREAKLKKEISELKETIEELLTERELLRKPKESDVYQVELTDGCTTLNVEAKTMELLEDRSLVFKEGNSVTAVFKEGVWEYAMKTE